MAPRKPLTYAGPPVHQEQLNTALQSAEPEWTAHEVTLAAKKLASIGIDNVDGLAQALTDDLNERLKRSGIRPFAPDTIVELRK
eukprot:CAMPEP_0179152450 /NCGR_PEP_ID=MMETSP0796-20121207/74081_1 /TAXON_ID=73915 /ORGANISM="Pyrodinium bahamense, Strain pbaha01" /LENGTH=83 /DNA_ID=CAMNT_0020853651 /DNA_START=9 /DNA_END=257 /DNA_ORIENTATION=+